MDRIQTGIEGFDNLINGGFPKGSIILICGPPGSGKTIFSIQLAYNFAKKNKKVLYILIGIESESDLIVQAESLGMNLKNFIEEGKIRLIKAKSVKEIKDSLKNASEEGFSSIILDSISTIMPEIHEIEEARKYIFSKEVSIFGVLDPMFPMRSIISGILEYLKELKFDLVFITADRIPSEKNYSTDKVSEFLVDGVIELRNLDRKGAFNRSMRIVRLRKSNHSRNLVAFEIVNGKGMIINHSIRPSLQNSKTQYD